MVKDGVCSRLWSPAHEKAVSPLVKDPEPFLVDDSSNEVNPTDNSTDSETSGLSPQDGKDHCPSYGWPTPDDPYGRIMHPHIVQMLPQERHWDTPSVRSTEGLNSTLLFWTFRFEARICVQIGSPRKLQILDGNGEVCGVVNAPCERRSSDQMQKILLLSVAPFGILTSFQSTLGILAPQYRTFFDASPEDLELVKFYNVMLVNKLEPSVLIEQSGHKQSCGIYERKCIGIVHRIAFEDGAIPIHWTPILLK
jgi:hypothetical protein